MTSRRTFLSSSAAVALLAALPGAAAVARSTERDRIRATLRRTGRLYRESLRLEDLPDLLGPYELRECVVYGPGTLVYLPGGRGCYLMGNFFAGRFEYERRQPGPVVFFRDGTGFHRCRFIEVRVDLKRAYR